MGKVSTDVIVRTAVVLYIGIWAIYLSQMRELNHPFSKVEMPRMTALFWWKWTFWAIFSAILIYVCVWIVLYKSAFIKM